MKFKALLAAWVLSLVPMSGYASNDTADELFAHYELEKKLTPAQIEARNLQRLALIDQMFYPANGYAGRVRRIAFDDAERLLSSTMNNPVASLDVIDKYDLQGNIGFCFGRAMTAHLEAIHMGIDKGSVLKLWAIGPMGQGSWAWHVTTLVKGPGLQGGESWWAIDPIFGQVMTASQWHARMMEEFSDDQKMAVYITPADKFGPSGGKYLKGYMNTSFYNGYFVDLIKYFQARTKQPEDFRTRLREHFPKL